MEEVMNLLEQVNKPTDLENMTDMEKKHYPAIVCPGSVEAGEPFECTVHVGRHMEHPNEPAHHIEFIDLYLGRVFLCRADLQAKKSEPKVTFNIALPHSGALRAYGSCNIHGVWASEKEITAS